MEKLDKTKIKKYWNKNVSDNYLRSGGPPTLEELSILRHKIEMKRFLKNMSLKKTFNFLELGCGSGRYSIDIAPMVKKIVALDFSKKQINQLKQEILRRKIKNIIPIYNDMTRFRTKIKFDLIFLSGVTQYIEDDELIKSLRYLKTRLNPNGIMFTRDSLNSSDTVYVGEIYPCKYRSKKSFISIFEEERFENIKFFSAYSFIADGLFRKVASISFLRKILFNQCLFYVIESILVSFDKPLLFLFKKVKRTNVDAQHLFSIWKNNEE